jgi:hypothetical protein
VEREVVAVGTRPARSDDAVITLGGFALVTNNSSGGSGGAV